MIIQTNDLCKTYGRHNALSGLNLSIPEGAALALIGANGAGKTTAIKVMTNILAPSAGSATVLGVDSRQLSPREFSQIGYVSENQNMPGRLGQSPNTCRICGRSIPTWDRELEVLNSCAIEIARQPQNPRTVARNAHEVEAGLRPAVPAQTAGAG